MNHEFDKFATNYRAEQTKHLTPTGENSQYFAQLKAQKLKEWSNKYRLASPQKILDFGCGDGIMSYEVKKLFPSTQLYGVDPSFESIELAKKNVPNAHFYTSGTTLSFFESNMFDIIYCAGVFHHIPFDEHDHYLQELHRVLRPGGIIVLFELNPFNPGTKFIFIGHPMETNAKMLTPWYTKKVTTSIGYKETIFYCFFPKFLQALRPLEQWLTKLPLGGLYATITQK
jgi:ubiquinone/menaquinone biosynthesis C-methylase UbiE